MSKHKWSLHGALARAVAPGPDYQYASMHEMDRFVRQIAAVGFKGLDMFDFNLNHVVEMFGSLPAFEAFLQERGIERLVGIFHAAQIHAVAGAARARVPRRLLRARPRR